MAEEQVDRDKVKALARAMWSTEMNKNNPNISAEDRRENWKQYHSDYNKRSRKVLKKIEKAGYSIVRSG